MNVTAWQKRRRYWLFTDSYVSINVISRNTHVEPWDFVKYKNKNANDKIYSNYIVIKENKFLSMMKLMKKKLDVNLIVIFIVNFEHISHLALAFLLLTLSM